MDFFGHQDEALRRSRWLLVYYILAVVLIVIATHAVVIGVFIMPQTTDYQLKMSGYLAPFLNKKIFGLVALGVFLVVSIGSIFKTFLLRKGGHAVALSLGGEPVLPDTQDPYEKRALNVTEEMAISAGIPVPTLYILNDEQSINAFAAGYTFQDAVVGITKGCARKLTRDELQGVIAHEFSHILNADMKLNLRLIGILQGILGLYVIGRVILRVCFHGTRSRSSRGKNGGGGLPALVAFGFGLIVVGSVGAFFARIIQSAVSRQREYLADASAVQFTRNPLGIAGALKKIGGFASGSKIQSPRAEEASHMFFSEGISTLFSGLFATHPPLQIRIQRLDSSFNGEFDTQEIENDLQADAVKMLVRGSKSVDSIAVTSSSFIDSVGTVTRESVERAQSLIWSLPEELKSAAHDKLKAQAIPFLFLLSEGLEAREKELNVIRDKLPIEAMAVLMNPLIDTSMVSISQRLPLLDLAIPSLKLMSAEEYAKFNAALEDLLQLDGHLSLFEFILVTIIHHGIERKIFNLSPPSIQYNSLNDLIAEVGLVVSALANAGSGSEGKCTDSFREALKSIGLENSSQYIPHSLCEPKIICQALNKLALGCPNLKRDFIKAAARAVSIDGLITPLEGELLRAVCETLDCPTPVLKGA
jgi:Zn-dependent protease with chaperone function